MTELYKPIKDSKKAYREAIKAKVKANRTDVGGNFYIYDLYDISGRLVALNRYCIKNSEKQPFDTLTEDEELILNPPIEESEPMEMI